MAAVLLAAGRGSRFGGAKLSALLGGQPLGHHAAAMLAHLPFAQHIAVVAPDAPDFAGFGFALVPLDPPGAPLSRSIALGVAAAQRAGAEAVLIALADMPLVPATHITALVQAFDGDRIASRAAGQPLPPAIFGKRHFTALASLAGDRGAGGLLADAPWLELPRGCELDVDSPADLTRAAALLQG